MTTEIDQTAVVTTAKEPEAKKKPKRQPPYKVVLLDDDSHTFEYVVTLCQKLFGHTVEQGWLVALEVHESGLAVLWTGPKEVAELKQQQVHSLGKDPLVEDCAGSMTAVIEPVE